MTATMTRAQAAAAGLNKYFTGKTCTNGHVAERYTQSGTCEGCLRDSQRRAQAVHNAANPHKADRKRFALHVCCLQERIPEAELGSLQTIAEALLSCRFPALVGVVEMRCNPRPCKPIGETIQATFLAHVEDRAALHSLCADALRRMGSEANIAARIAETRDAIMSHHQ